MNIRETLNSEFSRQHLNTVMTDDALERYVRIAEGYAEIENVLAVLSDLHTNKSYVIHGSFPTSLTLTKKDIRDTFLLYGKMIFSRLSIQMTLK